MPTPAPPGESRLDVPRRRVIKTPPHPGKRIRFTEQLGPKQVLAVLFALGALALWTVAIVSEAPYLAWFLGPTVGVFCGLGLWGLWTLLLHPRHGRLEVLTADGRLWFPTSRPLPVVATGGWLLLTVVWVLVVVGVVEGSVDLSGHRDAGILLLGFITVPLLVSRLRRRVVDPRLGLGPDDVLHETRDGPFVVAWNQISGIQLSTSRGPRLVITVWGRVEAGYRTKPLASWWRGGGRPTGSDWMTVSLNVHSSDPALVELLLHHDHRHPQHRHELGTPTAEEHIQRGDFGPGPRQSADSTRTGPVRPRSRHSFPVGVGASTNAPFRRHQEYVSRSPTSNETCVATPTASTRAVSTVRSTSRKGK